MATTVLSPRHLVKSHLARINATAADDTTNDLPTREIIAPPAPGDVALYSFYEPSLKAGSYTFNVSQRVHLPSDAADVDKKLLVDGTNTVLQQPFEVIAPQFAIEPKDIHSTYPPQGHADQPNVLPHIVFNDPHLPWERSPPLDDQEAKDNVNSLPWLALIPFDCNGPTQELRLPPERLSGTAAVYKNPNGSELKQTATFTISMTLKDYFALSPSPPTGAAGTNIWVPPIADVQDDLSTIVEVIFMTGKLFKSQFASRSDPSKVDIDQHRFCAHVKNVNTHGMTSAGVSDDGLFSVVFSRRSGPLDIVVNTAPRTQVVHMISLEGLGVGSMTNISSLADTDLVAFVSLYSWTYLCQPPLTVNFTDSMRDIGNQLDPSKPDGTCMLRCPIGLISSIEQDISQLKAKFGPTSVDKNMLKVKSSMLERLKNGFSLVRQRTALGDETVAITRGPLLPVVTQAPRADWPYTSQTGQDYQILDPDLGLMDVSYSNAWQLGKTLAISDLGFVGALLRMRQQAHAFGTAQAKIVESSETGNFKSKAAVIKGLQGSMSAVHTVGQAKPQNPIPSPNLSQRATTAAAGKPPRVFGSLESTRSERHLAINAGVKSSLPQMTSVAGSDATNVYNELRPPQNTDWGIVLSWLLDRMYLHAIPGHYLVPEPSFLPPESIRFFHIDRNWMDAFMDGALSIANHLATDDDAFRAGIKDALNSYFESQLGTGPLAHHPQIPIYGFIMRSAVLTIFPDLHVDAPFPITTSDKNAQMGRSPILVQKLMGKDTLMCLFDRHPDGGEFQYIKLSQPPHQQRFSVGDFLDADKVEFLFRDLFPPNLLDTIGETHTTLSSAPNPKIYNWDSRCLNLDLLNDMLFGPSGVMPGKAANLTSAMVALELNDPAKFLQFEPAAIDASIKVGAPCHIRVADDSKQMKAMIKHISALSVAKPQVKLAVTPSPVKAGKAVEPPRLPTVQVLVKATTPASSTPNRNLKVVSLPNNLIGAPEPPPTKQGHITPAARKLVPGKRDQQYTYCVFQSTSSRKGDQSLVYSNTPYPPDLIFAVNRRGARWLVDGLHLRYVQFTIPVGDPKKRGKQPTGQGPVIPGPGLVPDNAVCGVQARMLNNQRWVVHPDATSTGYFVWRVVPRSMLRECDVAHNINLSFKLDEVEVGGSNGGAELVGGTTTIRVREVFGYWEGGQVHDQGFAECDISVERIAGWKDSMELGVV